MVAVDWDARTLRVVHAHLVKRGVKIDRLLSVVIPSTVDVASPEQMGRHIRQTLDQEGITTRHAIVDIPRDQAILKTLSLPTTQPDELPGMVAIQIAKELPFPVGDAVIDFAVAPPARNQPSGDVLVAAVRREVLEQYEATLMAAGLKSDRVGLRPYANKVAVDALLKHAMPERVMFIDVRPTFMEIDILRQSALAFSRSASVTIPAGIGSSSGTISISMATPSSESGAVEFGGTGGGQGAAEPGDVIQSLLVEVTRSIEAYRANDPGARMDHVVVGGDVGVEEALAEAIQKRLNITTEIYNPASTFGWEPDEGAEAAAYAASLGLVLGHADDGALHFDFMHPKRMVSATKAQLKRAPVAAAIVVLFVTAAGVVLAGVTRGDRQRLAMLDRQIRELRSNVTEQEKFLKVVDAVDDFDGKQHVWVDVWYDLVSVLPTNEDLVLNQIEFNQKDGRITLKTRARERTVATKVVRDIEAFRRDGREKPRFQVRLGSETHKAGEKYAFFQDLRIEVLDDTPSKKGNPGS